MVDTMTDTTVAPVEALAEPVEEQDSPVDDATLASQFEERYSLAKNESNVDRELWQKCWAAYRNDWDAQCFEGKEDWQSQVPLAVIATPVDYVAAAIKSSTMSNQSDFFTVKGDTREGEYTAPIKKKILQENLKREKLPSKVGSNVKAGLVTPAPAFKVYPTPEETPWKGYCKIDPLDMRYYFKDTSGLDGFEIQVSPFDYGALRRKAVELGYDIQAVEDMKESAGEEDVRSWIEQTSRITGFGKVDSKRKVCWIGEYWGIVTDEDGNEVMPLGYYVVGNRKHVLKRATADPYGNGESPFVAGGLTDEPFTVYSRPFVANAIGPAEAEIDLFNATLDGVKFTVGKAWEADASRLEPSSRKSLEEDGIGPGSVFEKTGDTPVFRSLDTGGFPQEAFYLFQMIKQELQAVTSVTSAVQGMSDAGRGTKENTLGEVEMKANNASRSLMSLGERFETGTMEPMLRKMEWALCKYCDLTDPAIATMCKQEIADAIEMIVADGMAELEKQLEQTETAKRVEQGDQQAAQFMQQKVQGAEAQIREMAPKLLQEAMSKPLQVTVRGITSVMERDQILQRIMAILAVLPTMPEVLMEFDPRLIAEWIISHTGTDTSALLRTAKAVEALKKQAQDAQAQQMQMQQQMQQQQVQGQQMQQQAQVEQGQQAAQQKLQQAQEAHDLQMRQQAERHAVDSNIQQDKHTQAMQMAREQAAAHLAAMATAGKGATSDKRNGG